MDLGLNDRQISAVIYVKKQGSITNKQYQEMFGVSKRTATRDLTDLVSHEIFDQIGKSGKGITYVLRTMESN